MDSKYNNLENKKIEICSQKTCTGCAACINVCPRQCIVLKEDHYATLYPDIDYDKCIGCKSCIKACPNNNVQIFNFPTQCYAAYELNNDKWNSASGGIASAIYHYAISHDIHSFGVSYTKEKGAKFIKVIGEQEIQRVKNSKYVFSHTDDTYKQIKEILKRGEKAIFIGLPCQVAGLKTYLKGISNSNNLLLIDLLCHGVSNEEYLKQFIEAKEKQNKKVAKQVYFRDPFFYTYTYTFTLSDNQDVNDKEKYIKGIFYKRNHHTTNTYMLGYMNSLTYRENCYGCKYARVERVSDITIGDFDGLGKEIPFSHKKDKVSVLLTNTPKGDSFLSKIQSLLFLEARPLQEAVNAQTQLRCPAKKHINRDKFLKLYNKTKDFNYSAKRCLVNDIIINYYVFLRKMLVLSLTTPQMRKKIKGIIKKYTK